MGINDIANMIDEADKRNRTAVATLKDGSKIYVEGILYQNGAWYVVDGEGFNHYEIYERAEVGDIIDVTIG